MKKYKFNVRKKQLLELIYSETGNAGLTIFGDEVQIHFQGTPKSNGNISMIVEVGKIKKKLLWKFEGGSK